jgi:hypothetical protein
VVLRFGIPRHFRRCFHFPGVRIDRLPRRSYIKDPRQDVGRLLASCVESCSSLPAFRSDRRYQRTPPAYIALHDLTPRHTNLISSIKEVVVKLLSKAKAPLRFQDILTNKVSEASPMVLI